MILEGQTADYYFKVQQVMEGFDGETCWVQVRAGAVPGNPASAVMTMQKLLLSGSDVFYAINDIYSEDGGDTWSEPVEHTESFARENHGNGMESVVCDFSPMYHAATGKILGTGHTAWYQYNKVMPAPRRRDVSYSVYDNEKKSWAKWSALKVPEGLFYDAGAGCTQRFDLPNGEILLPVYFRKDSESSYATVLRCSFDGETLEYIEHGNEMTVPLPRGLGEPSLAFADGRYFLTLRNDEKGYVCASNDGLNFDEPCPWTFDDGSEIGNYNTQQHWITHNDKLFLVYTRRGLDNDHVFRHRAPLVMAEVDKEKLCIIKSTEQRMTPERGARMGNFGITEVSDKETWIVSSEWMQPAGCAEYGSNNAIFITRIFWKN